MLRNRDGYDLRIKSPSMSKFKVNSSMSFSDDEDDIRDEDYIPKLVNTDTSHLKQNLQFTLHRDIHNKENDLGLGNESGSDVESVDIDDEDYVAGKDIIQESEINPVVATELCCLQNNIDPGNDRFLDFYKKNSNMNDCNKVNNCQYEASTHTYNTSGINGQEVIKTNITHGHESEGVLTNSKRTNKYSGDHKITRSVDKDGVVHSHISHHHLIDSQLTHNINPLIFLLFLVLTVLACIMIGFTGFPFFNVHPEYATNTNIDMMHSRRKSFGDDFFHLRSQFKNQSKEFWITISAALKSIFIPNNIKEPATVLIGTSVNTSDYTIKCLSNIIASFVNNLFMELDEDKHLIIDAQKFLNISGDDAKLSIDNEVQSSLENGNKAVVLWNIHDLHPHAAMLLHSYCDNANALNKQLAFIFTVKSSKLTKSSMEYVIENRWKNIISADNLPALMSRIGNNIVIANSETDEEIQKICPHLFLIA